MDIRRTLQNLIVTCALGAFSAHEGHAVTIILAPAGLGPIGNTGATGGPPPSTRVGGGTLDQIFASAAQYWESAILDNYSVTIKYGWGDTGSTSTLSYAQTESYAGSPIRPNSVGIVIRNQGFGAGTGNWFLDSTPSDNSEFGPLQTTYANAALCNGAANCVGVMTTGLVFDAVSSGAVGNYDLLTVAIHEIGHALGLSSSYFPFSSLQSGYIPITDPLPFAGAHIFDFYTNGHLDPSQGGLDNSLMQAVMVTGERRMISQADLLAVCEVSSLANCVFDQSQTDVPEPVTSTLILSSAAAALVLRRRLAR